jgi:hypothetical protein
MSFQRTVRTRTFRDLCRGINKFKMYHHPRSNLMKDENGDLLADSRNILNMWKNYFFQLLNVYRVSDARQIEEHTAELLEPDPSHIKDETAICNFGKGVNHQVHVAQMGEKRNAYRILVGKPEGKRPLGRLRRRCGEQYYNGFWRDRMGWCGLDRCGSGWGPVVVSCEHGNELSGSLNDWEVLEWLHS